MNINPASSDLFDYSKLHKSLQEIHKVAKNTQDQVKKIENQEMVNNSINKDIEYSAKVFKQSTLDVRNHMQEINKIPFPMLLTSDRLNINKG